MVAYTLEFTNMNTLKFRNMKRVFVLMAMMALALTASAGDVIVNGIRVPSGYQAHVEYSNLVFLKDGETGMSLSTTHGFFYTENMHVGLGIGLIVAPDDVYVPVFTSAKYVFNPIGKRVSPTAQMRLGSVFADGAKPYADVAFGFRFASDRDFAFSVLMAGSYYAPFNTEVWTYNPVNNKDYYTIEERNLSCISLRVGIEW